MLHENIAKIRKERGLTQEALAVKLNVVRQTISKWEKGAAVPDADTLCRIAEALDVSVSVLLGESTREGGSDTASIAASLAQINEQLAGKNRRAASFWRVVCLVSLILLGILLGKVYYGNRTAPADSMPDIVVASDVYFSHEGDKLTCSFVPSFWREGCVFTVTLQSRSNVYQNVAETALYENGICVAVFKADKLSEYEEYGVVLRIVYGEDVRNLSLARVFRLSENGCLWE